MFQGLHDTRHQHCRVGRCLSNVMEEHTVRFLNAIMPTVSTASPVVYLGTLVGVINTCLFYFLFGRGLKLFLPYLILGAAGSVVGLTVGEQLPESGPMLGELHVVAATIATWAVLFIARSLRL